MQANQGKVDCSLLSSRNSYSGTDCRKKKFSVNNSTNKSVEKLRKKSFTPLIYFKPKNKYQYISFKVDQSMIVAQTNIHDTQDTKPNLQTVTNIYKSRNLELYGF